MTPFYRRLPEVAGFGVEATVDKIGLGAVALTAAGIVAHAVGSAVRKKPAVSAEAPQEQEE
jgi:hydrogenase small subunit